MKHSKAISIWRVLPLVLTLLPACLPLLKGGALPCTHDNDLHIYRITALRDALQRGWIFSRWVPNLALGYGYPFFNFREPLPYMFGAFLYLLGVPVPIVLGLIYVLSLLAAALGAYVLAYDLFGERAAWIAAVAYGLGPYMLLDALRRGNMPESVALALLPWLLFVFRRMILGVRRSWFIAAVLLLAALFLSHNISSLLFAPFLGGYVVLLSWLHRKERRWPWAFIAVAFALALTVWFWLPALTEQNTVHLHLSRTTRNNDFHYNFLNWVESLFLLPVPYDASFLNPPMRISLGILHWVLACVGVVRVVWFAKDNERRSLVVFFAILTVAYLLLTSSISVGVWESFSLLSFVQFPWRLVGRALLPVSLLAGAAFSDISGTENHHTPVATETPVIQRLLRKVPVYVVLVFLVSFSWPDTYPPKGMCPVPQYPTMEDVYAFELAGWMGVDPEGSYFPVTVEQHPEDTHLTESIINGMEPVRFDDESLVVGARIVQAEYRPLRAELIVETPEPFIARWFGFSYPGWQVRIDDAFVEIVPEDDTGFITFPIPAGRHAVQVRFGPTPLRAWVSAVSICAVLLFLALIFVIPGILRPLFVDTLDDGPVPVQAPSLSSSRFSHSLWGLGFVLLLAKLVIVDHVQNPWRRSRLDNDNLPEVTLPLHQPFADGLTLLGYDTQPDRMPADGELTVDLLWQARARPSRTYHTSVLLRGPDGRIWSSPGTVRPRGYEPVPSTMGWVPGQYAYDPHIVMPFVGTPPGQYQIVAALFDKDTLVPVSPLGADGNPMGPDLPLGSVVLTRPPVTPSLDALGVAVDAELQRCDPLGLWSMMLDREVAAPGNLVGLAWVWEALASPDEALDVSLVLRDDQGEILREWRLPPVATWWPTDLWVAGDRWVGRHLLRLPGGLDSGMVTLAVTLPECGARPLGDHALEIIAPERSWQVPPDLWPSDVIWNEEIRLAGYDVSSSAVEAGEIISVRLAWQAMAEMDVSYRVFMHLIDSDGRLLVQNDGEPAAWTRPTTGWAVDEVIVDVREIQMPMEATTGEYQLQVGVYQPDGPRLRVQGGGDHFVLGTIHVVP